MLAVNGYFPGLRCLCLYYTMGLHLFPFADSTPSLGYAHARHAMRRLSPTPSDSALHLSLNRQLGSFKSLPFPSLEASEVQKFLFTSRHTKTRLSPSQIQLETLPGQAPPFARPAETTQLEDIFPP